MSRLHMFSTYLWLATSINAAYIATIHRLTTFVNCSRQRTCPCCHDILVSRNGKGAEMIHPCEFSNGIFVFFHPTQVWLGFGNMIHHSFLSCFYLRIYIHIYYSKKVKSMSVVLPRNVPPLQMTPFYDQHKNWTSDCHKQVQKIPERRHDVQLLNDTILSIKAHHDPFFIAFWFQIWFLDALGLSNESYPWKTFGELVTRADWKNIDIGNSAVMERCNGHQIVLFFWIQSEYQQNYHE